MAAIEYGPAEAQAQAAMQRAVANLDLNARIGVEAGAAVVENGDSRLSASWNSEVS